MKQEILEKAHLNESSELARTYFKELGLNYGLIKENDLDELRKFILNEMYPLLDNKTYHMIEELTMDKKIVSKFKKGSLVEAYLYTNGSYFEKRQAVSFEEGGFIGFCGWASGCNRLPFIRGFIKWCDWMGDKNEL